jgi:hypothetical protein
MKAFFKSPKKIFLVLVILFLAIQFIRPSRNTGSAFGQEDITHSVDVPEDVRSLLVTACYDCHSDHTDHMWYENIQPVGWWIGNHIQEGKDELNFSVFNSYKDKRKSHKFEEITEMVEEDHMPLSSYTFIHGQAKLSPEQKEKLIQWAKAGEQKFSLEK